MLYFGLLCNIKAIFGNDQTSESLLTAIEVRCVIRMKPLSQ